MSLTNYTKGFGNATNFFASYSLAINAMIELNNPSDGYTYFFRNKLLSHMGVNKGIKLFDQKGINAVSKEMQLFHDREFIIPKNPSQLTK